MTIEREVRFLGVPINKQPISGPYYEELTRRPMPFIGRLRYESHNKKYVAVSMPDAQRAEDIEANEALELREGVYLTLTVVVPGDGDAISLDRSYETLVNNVTELNGSSSVEQVRGPRRWYGKQVLFKYKPNLR